MNKAAYLLVLIAALAAAAYFVLGSNDHGSGVHSPVQVSRSETRQVDEASPAGLDTMSAPTNRAEESDRKVMSVGSKAGDSPASSQTQADADAARANERGTVIGRVTDGQGAPLAGASVALKRRNLDDLFSELRNSSKVSGEGTGITDVDGRFSVSTRAGAMRLTVEADGFAPYSASVNVASDTTEDVGEVRVAQGVILRGRVVDLDDNGIAGASVTRAPEASDGITILGKGETVAKSDPSGYFEILRQAPGAYEFHFSHPEHPPATLKGQTERAGETVSDLRIVMDPGGVIRGAAVGVPAGTADLFAEAVPRDGADQGFRFHTGPETGRSAAVGPDGTFELRGLAAGAPYQVYLRKGQRTFGEGKRRSVSVAVWVPKEGTGATVQVPFSLGASVRFTVVDGNGAPHVPDRIEAGFDYPQRREDAEKDEATGRCVVTGLWPQADGQVLQFALVAQGFQKWEAKGLMIYPDDQVDLGQIVLEARPSVRVTVVEDATGKPVEGATVTLLSPPEGELFGSVRISASIGRDDEDDDFMAFDPDALQSGRTDAMGVCSLDASAGGTFLLAVQDERYAPSKLGPFTLPEQLTVYEQEVRLAEGGGLRVVALDPSGTPASGYAFEFKDDDRDEEDRQTERTGSDGVAEISGLRAGEHLVRLGQRGSSSVFMPRVRIPGMDSKDGDDSDRPWTSVTILPGEVVNVALEAPAIGVLVGTVTERGKALGSAKLKLEKAGDDGPLAGLMMFGGAGSPNTTSDARGEFRIIDVEAGDYQFVVEHPTRAMPYSMPITIEGGEQKVELDLSVTEVTGRAFDEHGEPLAGAKVEAQRAPVEGAPRRTAVSMVMISSDSGGGAGVMMTSGEDEVEPTTTDAEGRYRLRGVVHGVDLEVTATAKGYDAVKSERFRVGEGGVESDVDLRFTKAGSIRIEVEGRTGPVLAMLRRKTFGRGGPPKVELLRADSTTVDSLGAGKWTVTLQSANGEVLSADPDEVEVEVVGGETAVATFKIL
ncbi:Dioxygenase [Planctomycetes bacterium Poly30]|uniref:Dioxygenase n=1 Tax=Saltatorellus ferox TaxID=2528018 RepID=A0A518F0G9_9BACT|nr:Dioxygenase [Planctomycetes bacterium Poly30]